MSAKFWYLYLVSIITFFITVPTFAAEDGWELLNKGSKGNSDVYYKKDAIKKIDQNITEFLIYWCNAPNKCALQQIRVDSKNKKTAIGTSDIYINDVKTQTMDFSKAGWLWSSPQNNVQKKLINLAKGKK